MKIVNRQAFRDYEPLEKYEAGIALTGAEVKAIKQGRIVLNGSYVKIIDSQAVLVGAQIQPYQFARPESYEPQRTRKLLLHKKEILKLQTKMASGSNLTIVPIACYNKSGKIKIEIALARGRKNWERKRVEKERDEKRRVERELKEEIR